MAFCRQKVAFSTRKFRKIKDFGEKSEKSSILVHIWSEKPTFLLTNFKITFLHNYWELETEIETGFGSRIIFLISVEKKLVEKKFEQKKLVEKVLAEQK